MCLCVYLRECLGLAYIYLLRIFPTNTHLLHCSHTHTDCTLKVYFPRCSMKGPSVLTLVSTALGGHVNASQHSYEQVCQEKKLYPKPCFCNTSLTALILSPLISLRMNWGQQKQNKTNKKKKNTWSWENHLWFNLIQLWTYLRQSLIYCQLCGWLMRFGGNILMWLNNKCMLKHFFWVQNQIWSIEGNFKMSGQGIRGNLSFLVLVFLSAALGFIGSDSLL